MISMTAPRQESYCWARRSGTQGSTTSSQVSLLPPGSTVAIPPQARRQFEGQCRPSHSGDSSPLPSPVAAGAETTRPPLIAARLPGLCLGPFTELFHSLIFVNGLRTRSIMDIHEWTVH